MRERGEERGERERREKERDYERKKKDIWQSSKKEGRKKTQPTNQPVDSDDAVDVGLVANLGRHAKPPDLLLNSEYLQNKFSTLFVLCIQITRVLWTSSNIF